MTLDIACVRSCLAHLRFRQAAARHRYPVGPLEISYRPLLVALEADFAEGPLTDLHRQAFRGRRRRRQGG